MKLVIILIAAHFALGAFSAHAQDIECAQTEREQLCVEIAFPELEEAMTEIAHQSKQLDDLSESMQMFLDEIPTQEDISLISQEIKLMREQHSAGQSKEAVFFEKWSDIQNRFTRMEKAFPTQEIPLTPIDVTQSSLSLAEAYDSLHGGYKLALWVIVAWLALVLLFSALSQYAGKEWRVGHTRTRWVDDKGYKVTLVQVKLEGGRSVRYYNTPFLHGAAANNGIHEDELDNHLREHAQKKQKTS